MIHVHYDINLVIGSIFVALLTCYFAISIEQLLFRNAPPRFEKLVLAASGAILGLSIWAMHFVGMSASHMPANAYFSTGLTVASYVIAFIASIFAIWLTTRPTLPFARLILGAVLMGLGIAGMHYTGMMSMVVQGHIIRYDSLLVICSILIAISGSGLAFWMLFKNRELARRSIWVKASVALMLTLTIVGMHYTGMAASSFHSIGGHDMVEMTMLERELLITVVFTTCLVLVAGFSVAMLEQRLEQRSRQLAQANKELANQAVLDNLTKLPNRLYLSEYAHFLFNDHQYRNAQFAFLYIDLDRFKAVNDVFGHHVGDQLLIQLANRIHTLLNDQSKLLRIGGDEFLLIMENVMPEEAAKLAEDILHTIQESFLIIGKSINISGSIGISLFPEHGENVQDLLINADAAMLASKNQGRNTYSFFNFSEEEKESRSQSELINDLYKAVDAHQFELYYQPKFRADNLEICGVEALIRWQHPTLGLLSPIMFIKGAEKTGLIIPMGYWALEEACRQIQEWEQQGKNYFPIAVNLSAVQFEHKNLFKNLEELLARYQINPKHLMIEITESTAMHHIDSTIRTLEHLRDMGIQLAIDDFGTGHSSFLYLKNLPVNELKIDKEFIQGLIADSKEEMILESIIHLAIKLGLKVTAEGVETQSQADILARLGCEQLQGYLLSRPVHVQELRATATAIAS
ncbi:MULTISPECIES: bifunctional diguanylate cyclase/phosphodiesterase [Acinetobacter]|uniref:putative bifunctional diguanylate cyclase/phosphodiesterase n=1 Tax=Acinetobacter TaxID=469 RepID=UPI000537ADDE|nr:EAL domain-containing protein [Acinetobacter sp. HR7]KGT47177.1 diguanylate cyclase [Acinetobacter sp. HR7]